MTAKDTTRVVSDNSVSHAIEGPVPPRHGKQDRDVQVTSQAMDRLQEVENSAVSSGHAIPMEPDDAFRAISNSRRRNVILSLAQGGNTLCLGPRRRKLRRLRTLSIQVRLPRSSAHAFTFLLFNLIWKRLTTRVLRYTITDPSRLHRRKQLILWPPTSARFRLRVTNPRRKKYDYGRSTYRL